MLFTFDDVRQHFDASTFSRGVDYQRRRKVLKAEEDGDGLVIEGSVSGSYGDDYRQTIKLTTKGARAGFDGRCSCPMTRNCKHVVAVLLELLDRDPSASGASAPAPVARAAVMAPEVARWLLSVADVTHSARLASIAAAAQGAERAFRPVYVLSPGPAPGGVSLMLCKGKIGADGAIRSATQIKDLYAFNYKAPPYVREADQRAAQLFRLLCDSKGYGSTTVEPVAELGADMLRLALDDGVLFWADGKADLKSGLRQMRAGPPREGGLAWHPGDDQAHLHLGWQLDDGVPLDGVLQTVPTMYVHGENIGELRLPDALPALDMARWTRLVAIAPPLALADAHLLAQKLTTTDLRGVLPLPQVGERVTRDDIPPRPVLLFGSLYRANARVPGGVEWHDYGLLSFDYDGVRASADPREQLTRLVAGCIETIVRDAAGESRLMGQLSALGFDAPPAGTSPLGDMHGHVRLATENDWIRFATRDLPRLRQQDWRIEVSERFRFDLAVVDDWYAQVEQDDGAGSAWFELELGIVVDGDRVSLLPVLLQLIRQAPRDFDRAALEARGDDEVLLATLSDGTRVALAWGRVKPILRTLGELYFSDRIGDSVQLPTLDMARLAELEAGVQLRWMGGEHLRELGRKLNAFDSVRAVAAPAALQATLRTYQADGLAWMQFLREYGLAGILADDMGLGKTIQTLSHILVEKEAGRLTAPALVVAPTSLMSNWQQEAARFAPGLRVLTLTGPERLQRFGDIAGADLVLTSYALLPRDEAELRQHLFHLLILDESQYIKNHRAKAAQTAVLLRARHRLCLTGTPLQNHLGELWSQFHFLMPGLLGDEKTFNADFRKPIEKQGDSERNVFLIRRIKPFLLRRTKDHVAKELPPKTEMVRMVDLAGPQRDLYETVRLALDKKVREEIARKGVARSQIVILDALLKLRQVCCDPRLVKAAGKGKAVAVPSAKLEALMALMDELLDEGRKILVFSQFTSMLALIEAELQARGVRYALLTGDTQHRGVQVDLFQQGVVPVFLISLKAGGVGLNLTAADTVIHYDPWWNPAAENQATDRAWRIGQDKPVFVYRLIAAGTLEEKIQELQRRKAGLADAVLAGGEAQGLQITQDDLLSILSPL